MKIQISKQAAGFSLLFFTLHAFIPSSFASQTLLNGAPAHETEVADPEPGNAAPSIKDVPPMPAGPIEEMNIDWSNTPIHDEALHRLQPLRPKRPRMNGKH